jgi:DNA invertase Pin-like site-specific DNA recombinase
MPLQPEFLHLVYPGPFPTLLYGRASRDPNKKGRSVRDQMTVLKALCAKHNWPIVGIFDQDIDRSASRHRKRERDDFEALIEAIESGQARIVAAFEASRYYRDIEVYIRIRNACAENGVLFCYNGTVYDLSKREDRKATAQDALQAEDEAEGIRERNLRTARLLAESGAPYGRIPEGYARRYDPDTGDLLDQIEHPERGPVITEAFKRFDAGEGMTQIIADFKRRGLKNQRGGEWQLHHLGHILRNRAYIGRRVVRGEDVCAGQWPKLIDEETFWRVQQRLAERDKRKSRNTQVRWLLSGEGTCGPCDGQSVLRVRRNRGRVYYTCGTCFRVTMEVEKMHAYVETGVLRWLGSPAAAAAFQTDGGSEQAAAARRLRDSLVAQLSEARNAAATFDDEGKPLLSVMSLAALEAQLTPKIEKAGRAAEVAGVPPLLRGLVGANDVEDRWEDMTLPQQRDVLRAVVNIRLNPARHNGLHAVEPGRITMTYVGQPGFKG